jgi:hypothetical protein
VATNYVRYVDVDANAGGDGSTADLTGANCAFKSISIAFAWFGAGKCPWNLTTAGDTYTIICGSNHATNHTADTAMAYLTGPITSATSYIEVKADAASEYKGTWSTSKFRLEFAGANGFALFRTEEVKFIRVRKVQMKNTKTGTSTSHGIAPLPSAGAVHLYDSCGVFVSDSGYNGNMAFKMTGLNAAVTINFINCVLGGDGLAISAGHAVAVHTINMYSCVLVGYYTPVSRAGSTPFVLKNCYAHAKDGTAAYAGATLTTCASSDAASGSVGLRSVPYSTSTFANVTAGSEDFHLVTNSALLGQGTNTSGEADPFNFTVDIDGISRGSVWDVGVDQFVVPNAVYPFPCFKP